MIHGERLPRLALAALGVVFGDIATSPLYALQEAFGAHGVVPTRENVLGVLSLTMWSFVLIVSLKYIVFVMRADNRGEGGSMALLALARRAVGTSPRLAAAIVFIGLVGVSLFFGDSVITPAISVLSAIEGLEVVTPAFKSAVVPITLGVVVVLFAVQRYGTARVGLLFGPVMAIWLVTIAVLGVLAICRAPEILCAMNPGHAVSYFARNGFAGFASLGAVVLVLTGVEALYADMGHFGAAPIRAAWFVIAMPALLLSYFGQGAELLIAPALADAPFYHLVPRALLYPMVGLACVATVIASQAVISGAFSMTREAVQLGYVPRVRVLHTSSEIRGQVYLPAINALLFVLVVAAVIGFRSSNALAAAFGIAVSGTMLITNALVVIVARRVWRWSRVGVAAFAVVFVTIDLAYFLANAIKIESGGWFPLCLGLATYALMVAWTRGRQHAMQQMRCEGMGLPPFIEAIASHPPVRVPGTAVFLTSNADVVPQALLHNMKHNKILHEQNVVLTTEALDVPYAAEADRHTLEPLGHGFHRLILRFGFADVPNIPRELRRAAFPELSFEPMQTTYFSSRETFVAKGARPVSLALWRDRLFAFLARNSLSATEYFSLPGNRIVELGARVEV